MKRHTRDTGGFGKYIPHPTQGAKAEFSELSVLFPPMPTLCPQQPRPRAQDYGDCQRRRRLGYGPSPREGSGQPGSSLSP